MIESFVCLPTEYLELWKFLIGVISGLAQKCPVAVKKKKLLGRVSRTYRE
jgi:hypothetical protein